jgi:3'-phosphoadenosine 5'-phosphosulfate sulfotransferase (PAPS reductase)/FAD synthetase
MNWDLWVKTWSAHAEMPSFRERVRRAMAIARDGATRGRLYVSLSGGKDSVAMSGLLNEAGIAPHAVVHAHCSLNLPESMEVCERTVQMLDRFPPLDVVEPQEDAWDLLARVPAGDISAEPLRSVLGRQCAAGNLLVQYCYETKLDGAFIGLRRDESKGRRANAMARGPIYRNVIDEKWTVLPIVWWSATDVWAFLVSRGLPIHPYYQRAVDELGLDPATLRVDWLFAPAYVSAQHGAMVTMRRLYPSHWRRLLLVRPDIEQYVP